MTTLKKLSITEQLEAQAKNVLIRELGKPAEVVFTEALDLRSDSSTALFSFIYSTEKDGKVILYVSREGEYLRISSGDTVMHSTKFTIEKLTELVALYNKYQAVKSNYTVTTDLMTYEYVNSKEISKVTISFTKDELEILNALSDNPSDKDKEDLAEIILGMTTVALGLEEVTDSEVEQLKNRFS